ncbi:hypothetical protein BVY04_05490 [bacterium M21]|nr:hypothetical protein BVY04_05490 [bacterium M21]
MRSDFKKSLKFLVPFGLGALMSTFISWAILYSLNNGTEALYSPDGKQEWSRTRKNGKPWTGIFEYEELGIRATFKEGKMTSREEITKQDEASSANNQEVEQKD